MHTTTYNVTGMTCSHCVSSVTKSIGKLDGVTTVDVDLDTGAVTVTSTSPLDAVDVATAIDDAGYELAS